VHGLFSDSDRKSIQATLPVSRRLTHQAFQRFIAHDEAATIAARASANQPTSLANSS